MTGTSSPTPGRIGRTLGVLGDEGLRLFFPLAAVHAALWPFLWVVVHGYDLPLAREVPPSLWHAHEMLIGTFGGALIGFITTAVPEWTDTPRPRGRPLFVLATLWAGGRIVGFAGADVAGAVAAVLDLAWLCGLVLFVARVSWCRRTTRLLAFLFWIAALTMAEAVTRYGFLSGDVGLAQGALRQSGFALLALLSLVLARISVPITNLVLDPSETTSPFRPHPGRLNLAAGLVAVMMAGDLAGLSETARAYLAIAAGAAFLDRTAEAFVGRSFFRGEILALGGSSALAGIGLLLVGAARLRTGLPETTGLHVALMGGLGLGVLAVFAIAGLLHTHQPLGLSRMTRLALAMLVAAVGLRVAPDFGAVIAAPTAHGLASLAWAAAFILWLASYWPALSDPATLGDSRC
ncbi:MAG: NnrS family protein [Phreatobacter sp.]|uniref:NnrS family protein n=1 Tax=Phreatobacter sp. TaxID=1966341 RepID=UPI001A41245A|nr:NnrS family protein [Phreatobacter sp.]MBL8570232.1 NnrS family protein [Phreatobacter sp.]